MQVGHGVCHHNNPAALFNDIVQCMACVLGSLCRRANEPQDELVYAQGDDGGGYGSDHVRH